MTCSVCKGEMHLHNIQIREHHRWRFQFSKMGFAVVCVTDPVHTVDLLLYDVWI